MQVLFGQLFFISIYISFNYPPLLMIVVGFFRGGPWFFFLIWIFIFLWLWSPCKNLKSYDTTLCQFCNSGKNKKKKKSPKIVVNRLDSAARTKIVDDCLHSAAWTKINCLHSTTWTQTVCTVPLGPKDSKSRHLLNLITRRALKA